MEIRSKKSHRHLAPSGPKERRAKKRLEVAPLGVSSPPVAVPPEPTLVGPAQKDKGSSRRSPHLAAIVGETREKLMADAIRTTHIVDTRQHFPKVTPRRRRLQK